jgi:hypothetical protein
MMHRKKVHEGHYHVGNVKIIIINQQWLNSLSILSIKNPSFGAQKGKILAPRKEILPFQWMCIIKLLLLFLNSINEICSDLFTKVSVYCLCHCWKWFEYVPPGFTCSHSIPFLKHSESRILITDLEVIKIKWGH